MNTTPALPHTASALVGLIHRSSRTSATLNRDPITGAADERLTSSRLTIEWRGGELCIRCTAMQVNGEARRSVKQPRGTRAM